MSAASYSIFIVLVIEWNKSDIIITRFELQAVLPINLSDYLSQVEFSSRLSLDISQGLNS